jgi:ribosomal protein S18 acetylase RimI-like enzyme
MADPSGSLIESLTFSEVTLDDLEELVAIRIAAMRESLEKVGGFDPDRARARLVTGFEPGHCRSFELNGIRAGFYVLRPTEEGLSLEHLYVHPVFQRQGIGSQVMAHLASLADSKGQDLCLGALRESAANGFYARHGFQKVREDEWDIYYIRRSEKSENQL